MTKLTKRQQEILSLIQSHMTETGSPPTRAEIAKIMGFKSPNAAEDHLRALARKGVIELVPGTSRGIRLAPNRMGTPVLKSNQVDLSQPLAAQIGGAATCRVEKSLFQPSLNYLLAYQQKDLPDLSIFSGDYLAIQETSDVKPGQIVLLRSHHELIVRRFSGEHSHHLAIEGIVVGVIRPFTELTFL